MFAGIEEVQVKTDSQYIEPGDYLTRIFAIKKGESQASGSDYFVVELEVIESSNPSFVKGDIMAWMTMANKWRRYFLEEVKGFVASATGYSPMDVTGEVVETVSGEGQPLTGQILRVRARAEEAKSGKTYTKTRFTLVDAEEGEYPPECPTSTDSFGPPAGADGGPALVAVNESEIPDFAAAAPDVGDGDNVPF